MTKFFTNKIAYSVTSMIIGSMLMFTAPIAVTGGISGITEPLIAHADSYDYSGSWDDDTIDWGFDYDTADTTDYSGSWDNDTTDYSGSWDNDTIDWGFDYDTADTTDYSGSWDNDTTTYTTPVSNYSPSYSNYSPSTSYSNYSPSTSYSNYSPSYTNYSNYSPSYSSNYSPSYSSNYSPVNYNSFVPSYSSYTPSRPQAPIVITQPAPRHQAPIVIHTPAPAPVAAAPITITNNNVNNNVNTNNNPAPVAAPVYVAPVYQAPTYVAPVVVPHAPVQPQCAIYATASSYQGAKVTLSWATDRGDVTSIYCTSGILGNKRVAPVDTQVIYPWKSTTCYAVVKKVSTGASKTCSVYVPVEKAKPVYVAPVVKPVYQAPVVAQPTYIAPTYVAPVKPTVTLASTIIPTYEQQTIVLSQVPYTGFDDPIWMFTYIALIVSAGYAFYAYYPALRGRKQKFSMVENY